MLSVRDYETHQANPRPKLPGWARFTPGVLSREKNNRPDRILNALGYPEPIWWLCWRRRVRAERRVLKDKKDSRAPGVSLLGLSHGNLGGERHSFIFGIRKAWFRIPPTEAPQWRSICLGANLSQRNPGIENRGTRKRLLRRRFPRASLEIPQMPLGRCVLPLGSNFFDRWVLPPINRWGRRRCEPAVTFILTLLFWFFACSSCLCALRVAPAEASVDSRG
jgi:hypothetical protein